MARSSPVALTAAGMLCQIKVVSIAGHGWLHARAEQWRRIELERACGCALALQHLLTTAFCHSATAFCPAQSAECGIMPLACKRKQHCMCKANPNALVTAEP
jgi:hypothetical protein